jgi:hypothetical protein
LLQDSGATLSGVFIENTNKCDGGSCVASPRATAWPIPAANQITGVINLANVGASNRTSLDTQKLNAVAADLGVVPTPTPTPTPTPVPTPTPTPTPVPTPTPTPVPTPTPTPVPTPTPTPEPPPPPTGDPVVSSSCGSNVTAVRQADGSIKVTIGWRFWTCVLVVK